MEKINIAIIGAGIWGEKHVSVYNERKDVEVVAICDLNIQKAMAVSKKYSIKEVYNDYNEMLKKSKCDAVAIVTPDFQHAEIAIACANAKKHMLIEKPLATSREDVYKMVDSFTKNKVRVMVDLHNRWSPPFAITKQSIENGELGKPLSAYFRLNDRIFVPTGMLSWASLSSIIWFLGTHSMDTLRWLFNDEVERVYSVSQEGILKSMGIDTPDTFLTTIEFKGGGIAHMENSWIIPDTNPCINDIKFNILGTKGMISIDASNHNLIQKYGCEKVETPDILVTHYIQGKPKGFAYESINHFIDRLIDGKEFYVTIDDAAKASLILCSVLESAKTRQPVIVEY